MVGARKEAERGERGTVLGFKWKLSSILEGKKGIEFQQIEQWGLYFNRLAVIGRFNLPSKIDLGLYSNVGQGHPIVHCDVKKYFFENVYFITF